MIRWGSGCGWGYHDGYHHGFSHGFWAGVRVGHGGYWGPGGPRTYNRNVNVNRTTNINVNRNVNIYNGPDNRNRNARPSTPDAKGGVSPKPSTRDKNDVLADRDGNVARKTNDGWTSPSG